jgi:hypothetical protein
MMANPPRGCVGATDADGRVTLQNFPPGPARVEVGLFNSRFIRRLTVPDNGQENVIAIPDGLTSVHVSNAVSGRAVDGANIVWTGDGGTVEAFTTVTGDALLESVGSGGGTMTIRQLDYEPAEAAFEEPPAMSQVPLQPLQPLSLKAIVVNRAGERLRAAVVALSTTNALDEDVLAVTNRDGVASFSNVPQGPLRLTTHADNYTPSSVMIARDSRTDVVITLTPPK